MHSPALFLSVSCPFLRQLIRCSRFLGLTVCCEDIVNNVVIVHLAQPHLKLPRVVRSWCGRIEKKDISTITAHTVPTIYSSLHPFFFNRKIHRLSQLPSSAVIFSTRNSHRTASSFGLPTSFMHQECSIPNRFNSPPILPFLQVKVTSRLSNASKRS